MKDQHFRKTLTLTVIKAEREEVCGRHKGRGGKECLVQQHTLALQFRVLEYCVNVRLSSRTGLVYILMVDGTGAASVLMTKGKFFCDEAIWKLPNAVEARSLWCLDENTCVCMLPDCPFNSVPNLPKRKTTLNVR